MSTFSAASVAQTFLAFGDLLAPIAWAGAAFALGTCVAIVAAALHELRTSRRASAFTLTPGGTDVRRVPVRSSVVALHEAA